jgi:nucleotide-binding universal stress UspA family protein
LIVVGIDGTDHAHGALRFAIEETKLRGARLRVICAWELPVQDWGELPPPDETFDRFRRRAEEVLAEAAAIIERLGQGVEYECLALEGNAGDLLLQHSSGAAMVVVGSRGRGALAGLMLGSVSQTVVHDSDRPVVVVPHERS